MEAKKQVKAKAAKAIFDLYKAMPENIQREVKELILLAEKHTKSDTDELTMMANQSFGNVWNTPENDHWDDFLKGHS